MSAKKAFKRGDRVTYLGNPSLKGTGTVSVVDVDRVYVKFDGWKVPSWFKAADLEHAAI